MRGLGWCCIEDCEYAGLFDSGTACSTFVVAELMDWQNIFGWGKRCLMYSCFVCASSVGGLATNSYGKAWLGLLGTDGCEVRQNNLEFCSYARVATDHWVKGQIESSQNTVSR